MSDQQNTEQKKKGGCAKAFGIGCLSILILAAAGGFLAYRGVKKAIGKLSEEYTQTAPATLPTVKVSESEVAELFARVKEFSIAVKEGESASTELILTAKDLNVLIQKSPAWSSVAGKVYVRIEDNSIHGDASFPLDELMPLLKDRWLNGSASFKVETAAGRLLVFADSLSIRGKPLPEDFMKGLRSKNLAEEITKNPEKAALFEKLEFIKISDNKLHIKSR